MSNIAWNNLDTLESFKKLQALKGCVSVAKELSGAEAAKRVAEYSIPMADGLVMMEEIMHHQLYRVHSMQEIYDNYILCLIRGFCTERGLEQLDRALKE